MLESDWDWDVLASMWNVTLRMACLGAWMPLESLLGATPDPFPAPGSLGHRRGGRVCTVALASLAHVSSALRAGYCRMLMQDMLNLNGLLIAIISSIITIAIIFIFINVATEAPF